MDDNEEPGQTDNELPLEECCIVNTSYDLHVRRNQKQAAVQTFTVRAQTWRQPRLISIGDAAFHSLPPPRSFCLHLCPFVGRLVCRQDFTKTT